MRCSCPSLIWCDKIPGHLSRQLNGTPCPATVLQRLRQQFLKAFPVPGGQGAAMLMFQFYLKWLFLLYFDLGLISQLLGIWKDLQAPREQFPNYSEATVMTPPAAAYFSSSQQSTSAINEKKNLAAKCRGQGMPWSLRLSRIRGI